MNQICPECQGTTWITTIVDGRKVCTRCSCFTNSLKDKLLKAARIPERYHQCSIGNFETHGNAGLIAVADQIRKFVTFFPGDKKGLLLMGPPGIGKTHLAVGVVHYLIEDKNISCIFYDFRELLNTIRSTYDRNSQLTERVVVQPLLETGLLVLDELGAEKTTDWVLDILMYILNYRYNRLAPVIITTNYVDDPISEGSSSEETLEDRIGIRLRSRLFEMCHTISFKSQDYRKIKDQGAFQKGIRKRLKRPLEEIQ